MTQEYTKPTADYLPKNPVVLAPETYERHASAVDWIERQNRVLRLPGQRGKRTSPAAGAWGLLAAGATITGASGLTLGQGTVTLCTREDATITPDPDGETVTVYNTCPAITGDPSTGTVLPLHWIDAWVIG